MATESLESQAGHEVGADREQVNAELDGLKNSFAQLKHDMVDLFSRAFGLGRTSADAAKGQAADAMETLKHRLADLKERGSDQVAVVGKKIEENPLPSALIAFGVGFILAKLLGGGRK